MTTTIAPPAAHPTFPQSPHCTQHVDHQAGCPACRAYGRDRERNLRRLKAYGWYEPNQDATPVREHIWQLHDTHGMTWNAIVKAAGVSKSTLYLLRTGNRQIVTPANAKKILAVQPDPNPRRAGYINVLGVARRAQALAAIGHTVVAQAGWYGVAEQTLGSWLHHRFDTVTDANARSVYRAFDTYSMAPAAPSRSSNRIRSIAVRNRWAPPLAWNNIDDPAEEPYWPTAQTEWRSGVDVDQVAVERALSGQRCRPLGLAERVEAVRAGAAELGLNDHEIADRTGMSPETVQRIRTRHHITAAIPCTRKESAA